MSFSMTMGNCRMDRIKLLQLEKQRNVNLRKTGVKLNQSTTNTINMQTKGTLHYSKCPYCKQQILTNNIQHHISFCNSIFKHTRKSNCSACQQFRKK